MTTEPARDLYEAFWARNSKFGQFPAWETQAVAIRSMWFNIARDASAIRPQALSVTQELQMVHEQLEIALEALQFYANPETYHATVLVADRPAGEIADDYSEYHQHPDYPRPMLGARARAALARMESRIDDRTD